MASMTENAHKIAFLVEQYPKHKMSQIIDLLQMPLLDVNAGIWTAIELGLFVLDKDNVKLLEKSPEGKWFGKDVEELEEKILYCLTQANKGQSDLEEHTFGSWVSGYPAHNVLIAMRRLINQHLVAEYVIDDGENKYTFFTLYENRDEKWGRKQFKTDPLAKKEKKKR